jgi:aryl-alcohol dehydrogenase-like predicted oxidoreductase
VIEEVAGAVKDLIKAGRVRHFGTLVGAAAAARCIQLDGRGKMMRSPNGRCSRHDQSHSAARNPGRTRFPWASLSFSLEDCVATGSLAPGTAELLSRMIEAKLAFLISGGTGSGKTTLRLRHY